MNFFLSFFFLQSDNRKFPRHPSVYHHFPSPLEFICSRGGQWLCRCPRRCSWSSTDQQRSRWTGGRGPCWPSWSLCHRERSLLKPVRCPCKEINNYKYLNPSCYVSVIKLTLCKVWGSRKYSQKYCLSIYVYVYINAGRKQCAGRKKRTSKAKRTWMPLHLLLVIPDGPWKNFVHIKQTCAPNCLMATCRFSQIAYCACLFWIISRKLSSRTYFWSILIVINSRIGVQLITILKKKSIDSQY